MRKNKLRVQLGFTIIELAIAAAIGVIVMLGITTILVDSQRGWQRMYNAIYSDVATDSYVAGKTFDAVVRRATKTRFLLDESGNWAEVYYYADANSAVVDRYACFYYDSDPNTDGRLYIEYGTVTSDGVKGASSTQTVCENVSDCIFKRAGSSVQMILTLDDGSQRATVMSSAVMHNQ